MIRRCGQTPAQNAPLSFLINNMPACSELQSCRRQPTVPHSYCGLLQLVFGMPVCLCPSTGNNLDRDSGPPSLSDGLRSGTAQDLSPHPWNAAKQVFLLQCRIRKTVAFSWHSTGQQRSRQPVATRELAIRFPVPVPDLRVENSR